MYTTPIYSNIGGRFHTYYNFSLGIWYPGGVHGVFFNWSSLFPRWEILSVPYTNYYEMTNQSLNRYDLLGTRPRRAHRSRNPSVFQGYARPAHTNTNFPE